jgi:hypothetical protein
MKESKPARWKIIHATCGECIGTVASITVPLESAAAEFISSDGYHQPAMGRWCDVCQCNAAKDFAVRRA